MDFQTSVASQRVPVEFRAFRHLLFKDVASTPECRPLFIQSNHKTLVAAQRAAYALVPPFDLGGRTYMFF